MMFLGGIINAFIKLFLLAAAAGVGIFAGKWLRDRKNAGSR